MATNRNIVEMVEAIRKGTGNESGFRGIDGMYMANVLSVEPLTIRMHNVSITKNLFINPALMVEASNTETKMEKVFENSFETQEAYEFLKEFHEKFVLKKGDTVAVCVAGTAFYILGKAEKI